mmetsp:Transcript_51061/g.111022  ORF Transcript_51061/g.111022 Transcript_51061/m.111022 type:complete len:82 (-) Transcript_51061:4-249(-)
MKWTTRSHQTYGGSAHQDHTAPSFHTITLHHMASHTTTTTPPHHHSNTTTHHHHSTITTTTTPRHHTTHAYAEPQARCYTS